VPVKPGDDLRSLSARVQHAERDFLVDVLQQIADGTIALAFR
jgi:folate-dependent phosphoribosylglycinamide formyltransferase PurN